MAKCPYCEKGATRRFRPETKEYVHVSVITVTGGHRITQVLCVEDSKLVEENEGKA